jgi:hypothetical protein
LGKYATAWFSLEFSVEKRDKIIVFIAKIQAGGQLPHIFLLE